MFCSSVYVEPPQSTLSLHSISHLKHLERLIIQRLAGHPCHTRAQEAGQDRHWYQRTLNLRDLRVLHHTVNSRSICSPEHNHKHLSLGVCLFTSLALARNVFHACCLQRQFATTEESVLVNEDAGGFKQLEVAAILPNRRHAMISTRGQYPQCNMVPSHCALPANTHQ